MRWWGGGGRAAQRIVGWAKPVQAGARNGSSRQGRGCLALAVGNGRGYGWGRRIGSDGNGDGRAVTFATIAVGLTNVIGR